MANISCVNEVIILYVPAISVIEVSDVLGIAQNLRSLYPIQSELGLIKHKYVRSCRVSIILYMLKIGGH